MNNTYIEDEQIPERLPPVHPGEIIKEEFLIPMGISQRRFAICMNISSGTAHRLISGKQRVTGELALRLSTVFCTSPELWLNLQLKFDLETAKRIYSEKLKYEIQPLLTVDGEQIHYLK